MLSFCYAFYCSDLCVAFEPLVFFQITANRVLIIVFDVS